MTPRLGLAIAVVAAIALGAAGCGEGDGGTDVTAVAIATPGAYDDADWTPRARAALAGVARPAGIAVRAQDDVAPDAAPEALARLAEQEPQLLIAHDADYAAAAARVAREHDVPALVWGPEALRAPGLVANAEVDAAPAGYVLGFLLERSVGAPQVAILIGDDGTSWDAATWNRLAGGFVAGARHAVPDVRLRVVRVEGATEATMRQAAARAMRGGAPAVLALGGASTAGALALVGPSGGTFVGAVGPKQKVDDASAVIMSVRYDFAGLFRKAIADVRAGRFGERSYALRLADGGLRVEGNSGTPADAADAADAVRGQVVRGELQVPETPTAAALDALAAGGGGTPAR